MFGTDFIFDKESLSNHGMCIYDPDTEQAFAGRTLNTSDITPDRPVQNIYSATYDGTLELNCLIIKDENLCETKANLEMTGDDIHYIRSWLESPTMSELKVMQDDDDNLCTHYYGAFTNIQPFLVATRCYGLYLTFTCNAPYGFTDEYKYVCYPNSETTLMVSNLSAEKHSYYKPVITITSSSTFDSESLSIENANDNGNTMIISMPNGKSSIIIDCEKEMVFDSDGNILPLSAIGVTSPIDDNYSFLSADAFMFYWLRLAPNVNKLTILPSTATTISKVEITARYPVKSGGY